MTQLAEAHYKQSNELGKSTMGIEINIEKIFPAIFQVLFAA